MNHKAIRDFQKNEHVSGTYVLKSLDLGQTKSGTGYLKMVLGDESGDIPANMWTVPANYSRLEQGGLVKVRMTIGEYNEAPQGKVEEIYPVDPQDLSEEGVVPMAPTSPEEMLGNIIKTAETFQEEDLRELVLTALQENREKLLVTPAAMKYHQAVVGGLLWHISGMLKICSGFVRAIPGIDRDLLYTGVILHDIEKIHEYILGPVGLVKDYSTEGRLKGHLHMGASYVEGLCERLCVDPEKEMLLSHMLLSHHGKREWGAVVEPMTPEAFLLHHADVIDATMNQYENAYSGMEPGTFSTEKVAGTYVYKPKTRE